MVFGFEPAVVGGGEPVEGSEVNHGMFPEVLMSLWICISGSCINRNNRNTLFPFMGYLGLTHGKTSRFRRPRDFRKTRGVTIICCGRQRTGAVQGDGLEGGHPAGAASRRP